MYADRGKLYIQCERLIKNSFQTSKLWSDATQEVSTAEETLENTSASSETNLVAISTNVYEDYIGVSFP